MFKPAEREYRNFASLEFRNEDETDYVVRGYASTYSPYTLYRSDDYEWREQIDPSAFDEADMSDVVFLLDHAGRVYARTKNNTLNLKIDEKGLFTETDLSKTSSARGVYEDIKVGNYSQMSFAFTVGEDAYEEHTNEDGVRVITRTITKIRKVFDVSAVGFPANPDTDIGVATRSAFDGAIEKLEAERLQRVAADNELARQKLALKLKMEDM